MKTDWLSLGLACLTGASIGWCLCSVWTARWLDAMRHRQQQELQQEIEKWRAMKPLP